MGITNGRVISGEGGIKLGAASNTFDAGEGNKNSALALRDDYATTNPVWLSKYQEDFDKNIPSCVLLLFNEKGVPAALYTQYEGASKGWRELSTAKGLRGSKGEDGKGVCKGGTKGQVLSKSSDDDFSTEWVDQSGGSDVTVAYVDEQVGIAIEKTKEIIELNIKASKGVDVSKLNHYFKLVKGNHKNLEYNKQIPFSAFTKFDDSSKEYDVWKCNIDCINDLSFYVEFFNSELGKTTTRTESFISHSGRSDRVVTYNSYSQYPAFETIQSMEDATIDKARTFVCEVANVTVWLPDNDFKYDNIIIYAEDYDFGYRIGEAKLQNFQKVDSTADTAAYLSGTIALEPDYNAVLFCNTTSLTVQSKPFKTISNRSVRNIDLFVSEKRFDIGSGDYLISAISLETDQKVKHKSKVNITFDVPAYTPTIDKLVVVEETTLREINSVDLVSVDRDAGSDTLTLDLHINPDTYCHLELFDAQGTVVKTNPFLATSGNNTSVFNFEYASKTCSEVDVSHGTYDMIKANSGGGGESDHNKLKNLQGGGQGNYYHMDERLAEMNVKQTKGVFSARRMFSASGNGGLNLVNQSGANVLYGNTSSKNTQFSNASDGFIHTWADGDAEDLRNSPNENIVQKKTYKFSFPVSNVPNKKSYITKIKIFTGDDRSVKKRPDIGMIYVENRNQEIIYQNCPVDMTADLVDTYGNIYGDLVFELRDSAELLSDDILTVTFNVGSDYIVGGKNTVTGIEEPTITLVREFIKSSQVANVDTVRDIVPIAYSDYGYFDFYRDGEWCVVRSFKIFDEETINPNGKLVVPTTFENIKVWVVNAPPDNQYKALKEFRADSVVCFEYGEYREDAFFKDHQQLKSIYLPNVEEILNCTFLDNCPELETVYLPKLTTFSEDRSDFIRNCPNVVLQISPYATNIARWCNAHGVKYEFIGLPVTHSEEVREGFVLSVGHDKEPKWIESLGGRDEMAIHKYPDLTKDFHTFFSPSASGVYRCFGMMDNIPEGYFSGDNDFYAFVYAVSEKYKTVEIMDIRSGRRFTKCMLAGKWGEWFEWGINQAGKVPVLVWSSIYTCGQVTELNLSDIGVSKNDVLWVSCGNRGIALSIDNIDYLEDYSASYIADFSKDKFLCWMTGEGPTNMSQVDIYRFETSPVTPPRGGNPYLTLNDIIDDITTTVRKGDEFFVDVGVKSIELIRNPKISLDFGTYSYTTDITFDGKAKWYFAFPFQPTSELTPDTIITTSLSWQDQHGMMYSGFESVAKPVVLNL